MTILCGTDFSEAGTRALRVALKLAHRRGVPLHVAHATAIGRYERIEPKTRAELADDHRRRLEQQLESLRPQGVRVSIHVGEGPADEYLLLLATELEATLVIVGALGERNASKWQLGSHADRLAQRSHTPVLVVRRGNALEAWADGERPLRIVLGADLTESTTKAMHWIGELAQLGRCHVVATHLYWPPAQYARLGLGGARDYIEPVPVVTETLQRELQARLNETGGVELERLRVEPHLGRIGDRLASIAAEERADLVVVGSHAHGARSFWEGSVSRIALHECGCAVACVPAPEQASLVEPTIRSVLVATDFSPTGNAAVPLACAVAAPGATIHMVHVVPAPKSGPLTPRDIFDHELAIKYEDVRAQLGHLVPRSAHGRGQRSQAHVLESDEPAAAIAQAAERLGADVLCIGTHGRSGLAKTLLGSVAQDVVTRSSKPVLLARSPAL